MNFICIQTWTIFSKFHSPVLSSSYSQYLNLSKYWIIFIGFPWWYLLSSSVDEVATAAPQTPRVIPTTCVAKIVINIDVFFIMNYFMEIIKYVLTNFKILFVSSLLLTICKHNNHFLHNLNKKLVVFHYFDKPK